MADGDGIAGLLIEALDAELVVAHTFTGDDGSYLLTDLGGSVTLRISDPEGRFLTQVSDSVTPPATFNANLLPGIFVDGFESGDTTLWSSQAP